MQVFIFTYIVHVMTFWTTEYLFAVVKLMVYFMLLQHACWKIEHGSRGGRKMDS